ncbi:hypothetical protein [Dactylosporangium sp. CA-139066]|uniref:hypothetical protein n=1 Tax=Dactylosporangium sp. CA-139066 TaxID=3239930 RepID=UPI003D945A4B
MGFAAIGAGAYAAVIVMHVIAIRGRGAADDRHRPRLAVWLASGRERRRGRFERDAVRLLLAGRIARARYHTAMAAMAAQDDAEYRLEVPGTRR